ncbi:hypothetical protein EON65_36630 [archaeon]|nr:MAG: hypothetical protein EON65_36630 [archaeon]
MSSRLRTTQFALKTKPPNTEKGVVARFATKMDMARYDVDDSSDEEGLSPQEAIDAITRIRVM